MSTSGTPQTTTSTTGTSTVIPDWLSNAAQGAVQTAQDLSQRPYNPYTGEQVAPTPADTQTAYGQVRAMQGQGAPAYAGSEQAYTGLLGSAVPLTADALKGNAANLYGGFAQGVFTPAMQMLAPYVGTGPATAAGVGANAQALMSPYTQNVIDPTLAAGEQARQLARQTIAGNAANAGAFGGSRQGVAEGVSDAQMALGTQQQIGNMLTGAYNTALQPAYGLATTGAAQGLAARDTLTGLLAPGYANAQQTAYGMGTNNLQAGLAAAQNLPTVATAQQAYGQKDAGLLQAIGGAQQAQQQNIDTSAMGDWYAQQNWPVQNLDLLTSTLGGVPYSTSQTGTGNIQQATTQNIPGSILGGAAQLAGIAGGLKTAGLLNWI